MYNFLNFYSGLIARDHIGSIIPSPVIIEPYGHSHGPGGHQHQHQHGVYGQRVSGGLDSYGSYDQVYYHYDQSEDYSDQYQAYYTTYTKGEEAYS